MVRHVTTAFERNNVGDLVLLQKLVMGGGTQVIFVVTFLVCMMKATDERVA